MLRVGFVEGATPDKWARRWREREPEPLTLVPVDPADQRDVLDRGEVDLCLVRLPVDRTGLHLVTLYDETAVVVAAADHVVSAVDEIEVADLADDQLVYGAVDWPAGVDRVSQLDFPPMSATDAVATVATGVGVAVMPMSVARLHHRRDVVSRPVTDLPPTTIGLAWPVGVSPEQEEFAQRFVGVVRGRTAQSSRGRAPEPGPKPVKPAPARTARATRPRHPQPPKRRRGR